MGLVYGPRGTITTILKGQNVLLNVCRHWKMVACSVPRYWSLACIASPGKKCRQDHWSWTEERLARAGSHRLTVVFVMLDGSIPEDMTRGLEILDARAGQISTLIAAPKAWAAGRRPEMPQFRIPAACQKSLRQLMLGSTDAGDTFKDAFAAQLPLFERLSLLSIPETEKINAIPKCTERLHLFIPNATNVLRCLQLTPQLVHLQLRGILYPLKTHITQNKLVSLVATGGLNEDICLYFLHQCTFPALRYLHVEPNTPEWPTYADLEFFDRSPCIEHLSVRGWTTFDTAISEVLYSLPALKVAFLYCNNDKGTNRIPSTFLDALAKKPRRSRVGIPPSIVEFAFPMIQERQMARFEKALEGILERRSDFALKRIWVHEYRAEHLKPLFKKLEGAGVTVAPSWTLGSRDRDFD